MSDESNLRSFTVRADKVASFDELHHICKAYFQANGLTRMIYHYMPPLGASHYDPVIMVSWYGFPKSWARRYAEREHYRNNPVIKRALGVTWPIKWSAIRQYDDLSESDRAFFQEMEDAELGDGYSIPVFGPNGHNGNVSFGCGEPEIDIDPQQLMELQLASQFAHMKFFELLKRSDSQQVTLSKREHEILTWVVMGKSNAVIADIIGISTHTVDTYMRRLFVKLDASDRMTVALRGMAIGVVA
jgi:DNA-binding CsgD family transcriptional regulator